MTVLFGRIGTALGQDKRKMGLPARRGAPGEGRGA